VLQVTTIYNHPGGQRAGEVSGRPGMDRHGTASASAGSMPPRTMPPCELDRERLPNEFEEMNEFPGTVVFRDGLHHVDRVVPGKLAGLRLAVSSPKVRWWRQAGQLPVKLPGTLDLFAARRVSATHRAGTHTSPAGEFPEEFFVFLQPRISCSSRPFSSRFCLGH